MEPSNNQFNKAPAEYRKVTHKGDQWYSGTTDFTAYSGTPSERYTGQGLGGEERFTKHATASVNYFHPHETPNFKYRYGELDDIGSDYGNGPSQELFRTHRGEISSAFADRSMTPHVATLLGAVINEHRRLTGSATALPFPSDDLSPFSSKLVQNARKKGIQVPEHPYNKDAHITNDIDSHTQYEYKYDGEEFPGKALTAGERSAARQTIHSLLRRPQTDAVHPQQFGEQGRLFQ